MNQPLKSLLHTYLLFFSVIFIWGVSWPIMKIAIANIPAIWFTVGRLSLGTFCIFIFLACTKQLSLPKRQDWPLVCSIGILQMGFYLILLTYGLKYVEAGRSSILCYTTPIWVTPLAVIFFKESISKLKILGCILGLMGILVLFNPLNFDWHNAKNWLGNGLLLAAAVCWAIAMLHTRYGKWHSPPLVLVIWQMFIGTSLALLLACLLEPVPKISWKFSTYFGILFTGTLSTAFGYWGAITVSRSLPVITTSLCFLGVPVIGLISSAIFLPEKLTFSLCLAMLFILTGLICVAVADYRKKPESL